MKSFPLPFLAGEFFFCGIFPIPAGGIIADPRLFFYDSLAFPPLFFHNAFIMPLFLITLFFLSVVSCSQTEKKAPVTAKSVYEKALKEKESKQYISALETLRDLRKRFIYSGYSAKARLLMGDIYFEMRDYGSAESEYQRFLKIYPDGKKDYALYQLGLTYLKRLPPSADRDIAHADKALKYFNDLKSLKSSGPYKKQAEGHIRFLQNFKAEKEFKIASFYKKRGRRQAVLRRVKNILRLYPKSPLISKTLFLAWRVSDGEEALRFKSKLLKDFPDSPSAKRIKSVL